MSNSAILMREPSPDLSKDNFVEEICRLCGLPLINYTPDYFMCEKINPCCLKCNLVADENYGQDPYSSFPDDGLPPSIFSHWIPHNFESSASIGMISSFKAHYTQLPNPGDSLMSMEEVLEEFREFRRNLFEEQRQALREDCKQS